jgi:hypothetical protein
MSTRSQGSAVVAVRSAEAFQKGKWNMKRSRLLVASLVLGSISAAPLAADDSRIVERDGIKYQETTRTLQRPITETRYEDQEYTAYNDRYTTEMQEVQRTYQVAVTQNQWVPGYQRTWNVFAPPVLSYRLMPVTRMENRTETVRIPVTKHESIPSRQVRKVPVTKTHIAQEEHTSRVPIGTVGDGGALVANRNDTGGGTRMESDPPRTSTSGWRSGLEPSRP